MENPNRRRIPRWLVRTALYATYPFVALSFMMILGMGMGLAFVFTFTVENRTGVPISVTPVGTFGKEGRRGPLPIYCWIIPLIPASKQGAFEIPPGGSAKIRYDWDDVNFSEIVVSDSGGERGQLIIDPTPTQNQYHAPKMNVFVVSDFESLAPVPENVRAAARRAEAPSHASWIFACLYVVPWAACWYFSRLNNSYEPQKT